jgi:hypothetical protein
MRQCLVKAQQQKMTSDTTGINGWPLTAYANFLYGRP